MLNGTKWELASDVRIGFVDGDTALQDRVKAAALGWVGPDMANVNLKFGFEGDDADIRIAFEPGDGSWSTLGTECRQVPVREPTMNYGWLTTASSDDEVRGVVLHEFGHALGLIHEHQNPEGAVSWNRAAVIRDLSGPPNNWDEQTIEHNVFAQYSNTAVTGSDVDPLSIMMYPIPASWTTDGFSTGINTDLSATDRQVIRDTYPWN